MLTSTFPCNLGKTNNINEKVPNGSQMDFVLRTTQFVCTHSKFIHLYMYTGCSVNRAVTVYQMFTMFLLFLLSSPRFSLSFPSPRRQFAPYLKVSTRWKSSILFSFFSACGVSEPTKMMAQFTPKNLDLGLTHHL